MSDATCEVRIREARLADAARLADLSTQLGYPSTPAEMGARLELLLPSAEHMVLVAEEGGEAMGFAHVHLGIALETGPRAELLGLVTDQALRSRGIGRRLLAEAERWAAARGLRALFVRCNIVRTDAHRFYEALGYTCSKTQKYFRKPLAETEN